MLRFLVHLNFMFDNTTLETVWKTWSRPQEAPKHQDNESKVYTSIEAEELKKI